MPPVIQGVDNHLAQLGRRLPSAARRGILLRVPFDDRRRIGANMKGRRARSTRRVDQRRSAMPRLTVLLASAVALSFAGVAAAEDAAMLEKGKTVFESAKPACKMCHNEKKNSLDNYGAAGSVEEVKAWVRTPKEQFAKTGKKGMMPTFAASKISDEDLDALAAYLVSLKK
jgi:cytochrome c553